MAEGAKKGFVLYVDSRAQIDGLTNEEAGQLLKVIFEYVDTGNYTKPESRVADIVFAGIKSQIDRDRMRYEEKCEQNRKIALQREEKKRNKMDSNTNVHGRTRSYTDIDKDIDTDKESERDREISISTDKNKPLPPENENVVKWLKEKRYQWGDPGDDGKEFYHYYNAQGWLKGNGMPIRNWQSCCWQFLKKKYENA